MYQDIAIEVLTGLVLRLLVIGVIAAVTKYKLKPMHPIVGVLGILQYSVTSLTSTAITLPITVGFFLPELFNSRRFIKKSKNNK